MRPHDASRRRRTGARGLTAGGVAAQIARSLRRVAAVSVLVVIVTALLPETVRGPAPAYALSCPAGYLVRGLNCCRVRGGRVACQRNPQLPDALAPVLSDEALLVRPVTVDDSDIAAEAAAADPALAERPISEDPAVLAPVDDVCAASACDFDTIRAIARERRGGPDCVEGLRRHYCTHSPWRDLDLDQRFARLLHLGRGFAQEAGVDVRAMACIAAIETRYLEPLTISELACQRETSDRGLPQIIRPTFDLLVHRLGFRSRVADYGEAAATEDWDRIYSALGRSVRHQLELMAQVLRISGGDGGALLDAFIAYNGSSRSIAYGYAVDACFRCLQDRVDVAAWTMRGDPLRCLAAAQGGGDVRQRFATFSALCAPVPEQPPGPPGAAAGSAPAAPATATADGGH